jgi:hypothetical protein
MLFECCYLHLRTLDNRTFLLWMHLPISQARYNGTLTALSKILGNQFYHY